MGSWWGIGRRARFVSLATAALAGFWVWAAQADAHVYWANNVPGSIGRANLDGSGANQSLIAGTDDPRGVAVDGRHVYWANADTGTIGRANLDGSGANPSFIAGSNFPGGVAVDGEHVYWANQLAGTIGRANLDGSGVNQSFIGGANFPWGVAVDDRHVYWMSLTAIGRANLDGSGADQSFIAGVDGLNALAVDRGHVYWSNADAIGRASLDGSGVDRSFVAVAGAPIGVAVDDRHLYWSNAVTDAIGRANLDGTGVNHNFITGASNPFGLAVDGGPAGAAAASPASLAFGIQPLGTFGAPGSVTISNTGHGNLKIDAARIATGDVDDFLISHDDCSHRTLTIGATCTIGARFGPSAGGDRQATLELISNDAASPLRIALDGTGGVFPQGAAGPPGPSAPLGADRELLVVGFAADRYHARHGRRLRLRYVSTAAAVVTVELRRGRRVVRRVRGTAARGRNAIVVLMPRDAGSYSLQLTASAGAQRVTDRSRLTVT
jgi:hypothetical protein